jgi:hypothetical protein
LSPSIDPDRRYASIEALGRIGRYYDRIYLFIAGSNRRGRESQNQPHFGDSHVASPNGVLPSDSPHPNGVVTDVDLDERIRPCPAG